MSSESGVPPVGLVEITLGRFSLVQLFVAVSFFTGVCADNVGAS
jgi:hypothetical protein